MIMFRWIYANNNPEYFQRARGSNGMAPIKAGYGHGTGGNNGTSGLSNATEDARGVANDSCAGGAGGSLGGNKPRM